MPDQHQAGKEVIMPLGHSSFGMAVVHGMQHVCHVIIPQWTLRIIKHLQQATSRRTSLERPAGVALPRTAQPPKTAITIRRREDFPVPAGPVSINTGADILFDAVQRWNDKPAA